MSHVTAYSVIVTQTVHKAVFVTGEPALAAGATSLLLAAAGLAGVTSVRGPVSESGPAIISFAIDPKGPMRLNTANLQDSCSLYWH